MKLPVLEKGGRADLLIKNSSTARLAEIKSITQTTTVIVYSITSNITALISGRGAAALKL